MSEPSLAGGGGGGGTGLPDTSTPAGGGGGGGGSAIPTGGGAELPSPVQEYTRIPVKQERQIIQTRNRNTLLLILGTPSRQ
jgi:hypothetical protein